MSQDGYRTTDQVTLASGGFTPTIELGDRVLVGFYTPSTWTTADCYIEVSADGVLWSSLPADVGSFNVGPSVYQPVDPSNFVGVSYVRLGSNPSQGEDRTLNVISVNPS